MLGIDEMNSAEDIIKEIYILEKRKESLVELNPTILEDPGCNEYTSLCFCIALLEQKLESIKEAELREIAQTDIKVARMLAYKDARRRYEALSVFKRTLLFLRRKSINVLESKNKLSTKQIEGLYR